ncbi:MAG: SDR family NAD(P)-dependent oxidoreductase [Novosphingobium sp.]|nr:SDR family NAD(P)-dependent oxidoreductase [Novosphingobium sp.]
MSAIHPAIAPDNLAVITGGADGIGFAVAQALADRGMRVALADIDGVRVTEAAAALPDATGHALDVSDRAAVEALARELGPVSVLMNNAGTGGGGDALSNPEGWDRVLGTNLMGVLHGVQAFVPTMAESGRPGLIINTGSKQGITTPPGDTAYNVSKAGIKALTEGLAHTLRNREGCQVSAHLLIPGFTFTGMMRRRMAQKPDAAWEPGQVAERLLQGIAAGEFYILCEDNETTAQMDRKRIQWAAQDIAEGRPALSRWHPDWAKAFANWMASGD